MQGEQLQSKIIKEETKFEGKWLGLKFMTFSIGNKQVPNYEAVYRMPNTKGGNKELDGVQIIPIIQYKDKPSELVLIANFRPPTHKFALEFPSGLLEDSNYEENARRQCLEQTGYHIKKFIELPLPPIYCDPWKSNEAGLLYVAMIDGDDPKCQQSQNLDGQENIRVIRVPFDDKLLQTVSQMAKKHNYALESKVWSICMGLHLSKMLK